MNIYRLSMFKEKFLLNFSKCVNGMAKRDDDQKNTKRINKVYHVRNLKKKLFDFLFYSLPRKKPFFVMLIS